MYVARPLRDAYKEGQAEGREEGRAEGREEGRAEGREEERAEMARICVYLKGQNRFDDIDRAIIDPDYRGLVLAEMEAQKGFE